MSIRKKVTLALLVVTVAPLVAFAVAIFAINNSQVDRVGSIAQWQARSALEATAWDLHRAVSEVQSWATTQGIVASARRAEKEPRQAIEGAWQKNEYIYTPEARRLKQLQSYSEGRYAEIFYTDARGFVVASTNPTSDFGQGPEDDPPRGEPWWDDAATTGLRVGELTYDQSAKRYAIDISIALSDEDGFAGVLKAVYNVESILDIIGQANIGRDGHTVLVDTQGSVLAAPQRFRHVVFNEEQSLAESRALRRSRKGESGYGFDDIPWVGQSLVAYAPGTTFDNRWIQDWTVMLIIPQEAALISARQVQLLGLGALALVSAVVLLVGILLGRRMSTPLLEINSAVSQLEGGHFDVKVPERSGNDEIAQLGRSINSMTDRLAEYEAMNIKQIQSLNRELESANRELTQLATRDSLTGLVNVRVFREQLDVEIKRASRNGSTLALLLIDIDYFKKVNDSYGHQAGDAVLRAVGQLLRDMVRATDCAARYGGEEMAVLLPETSQQQAYRVAEKIRKLVMLESIEFDDQTLEVTVSIGVTADTVTPDYDGETLIKRADEALYNAKGAGRNRVEIMAAPTT